MFDDLSIDGATAINTSTPCRIANKAAMLLQYTAAAPDPAPMVDEALLLTLEMLQLTNLETISTRYEQRCENLTKPVLDSAPRPTFGAQWTADACQQLRDIGFQEKWIQVLGDELGNWSPCLVPTSVLTSSIQKLATECAVDANATTQMLLARDPAGPSGMPNLRRFSNAVCGLAIILTTLSQPDGCESDPPGSADAEAKNADVISSTVLTSFGAHLVVNR